jgi:hypothetical protein
MCICIIGTESGCRRKDFPEGCLGQGWVGTNEYKTKNEANEKFISVLTYAKVLQISSLITFIITKYNKA